MRFICPEGAAVVAQELERHSALVGAAKARLDRLDHHVAHRFDRQIAANRGTPSNDLAGAAVLHEYAGHHVAVLADDLSALQARSLALTSCRTADR